MFSGLAELGYHEEKLLFWCTRFTGISHLYDANASQKLSFTAAQSNAALEWIPKRVFRIKFARTPLCMLRLTFTLGKRNASSGAFRPESPFPIFVGVMYALERLIKISPSLRQLPRKVNCAWGFCDLCMAVHCRDTLMSLCATWGSICINASLSSQWETEGAPLARICFQ